MSVWPPELTRQRKLTTIATAHAWHRLPVVIGPTIVLVLVAVGVHRRVVALSGLSSSGNLRAAYPAFLEVLGFAAGVGVASPTTIPLAKQLFGVRSRSQWHWVREWIGEWCAIAPLWADWQQRHVDTPVHESIKAEYDPSGTVPAELSPATLADAQDSFAAAELE